MEIYFVRHGETDGNVARRHQHPDTSLNEVGVAQVEEVASKIRDLKPTHFITSTQLRAVETTKIISAYCEDIIPETNAAFEELHRPNWIIGSRYVGITTAWYVWRWFWGGLIDGGESYLDFILRIKLAREYLKSLPDDSRVVIVSHAVFTNIFLEHLCTDKPMSLGRAIKRFWHIFTLRNAAIIHIRYSVSENNTCGWKFISASRYFKKF